MIFKLLNASPAGKRVLYHYESQGFLQKNYKNLLSRIVIGEEKRKAFLTVGLSEQNKVLDEWR